MPAVTVNSKILGPFWAALPRKSISHWDNSAGSVYRSSDTDFVLCAKSSAIPGGLDAITAAKRPDKPSMFSASFSIIWGSFSMLSAANEPIQDSSFTARNTKSPKKLSVTTPAAAPLFQRQCRSARTKGSITAAKAKATMKGAAQGSKKRKNMKPPTMTAAMYKISFSSCSKALFILLFLPISLLFIHPVFLREYNGVQEETPC